MNAEKRMKIILHFIYADRPPGPDGINWNMNISMNIWYLTRIDWIGCAIVSTDLHHHPSLCLPRKCCIPTQIEFSHPIWIFEQCVKLTWVMRSVAAYRMLCQSVAPTPKKIDSISHFYFKFDLIECVVKRETNSHCENDYVASVCFDVSCQHSNRNTANCRWLIRLFDE